MPNTLLIVCLVAVALIVLVVLLRSLGSKSDNETDNESTEERHGVSDGLAAAVEDVIGELTGVDAHPATPLDGTGNLPPNDLTQIKGLGQKAAATLTAIGITRFDQIAGWNDDDLATVGAKLGNRAERIRRDLWIEQAGMLARGEITAFEAKFGKLG